MSRLRSPSVYLHLRIWYVQGIGSLSFLTDIYRICVAVCSCQQRRIYDISVKKVIVCTTCTARPLLTLQQSQTFAALVACQHSAVLLDLRATVIGLSHRVVFVRPAPLQCKKAERHISGMMIMDDGCYKLVQQQMGNPHIPSPWHVAMSGFSSSNGTALHSMDGATSSSKKKKKDVD